MPNTLDNTTTAFKKLKNLSDPDSCKTFLQDIKNTFRGTSMNEIIEGNKTPRGNLARLLTCRVYPSGTEARNGTETITAPANLGGDWGADLTDQAEELAWTISYQMMEDTLRERMSARFDRDGGIPDASALLRYILSKTGMTDSTAYDLKTKLDFNLHVATNMPDAVATSPEVMENWVDLLVKLNRAKCRPDGDWDLVQHALSAFPPDVGALMSAATERVEPDDVDIDEMKVIWCATIERHALRQQRHASGGGVAMAARTRDADFATLQAQVETLTSLLQQQSVVPTDALAAAAFRRPNPNHAQCPQMPAGCGGMHSGGLESCWFLHPDIVPVHMGYMLKGVHRNRAMHSLPDLSAKYPATDVRPATGPLRKHAARGAAVRAFGGCDPAFACVQVVDQPSEKIYPADPTPVVSTCLDPPEDDGTDYIKRAQAAAGCGTYLNAVPDAVPGAYPDYIAQAAAECDTALPVTDSLSGASRSARSSIPDSPGQLNIDICRVAERAAGVVGFDVAGSLDVDSMASVTLTPHARMFKPGSLVATSRSFVEVANGQREAATHIGTLLLEAEDSSGVTRLIEFPGAWLVPSLAMSLLSVRAVKALGWKAPDFDKLVMTDGEGIEFPIVDADPSYTLASRVVAPDPTFAAAVLARGRSAIPTTKSSATESADIVRASFGHLSPETIRSLLASTDGVAEPEKVLKGVARLGIDEANLLANASHKPAPDANVKDRVGSGFVAGDIKVMNVTCEHGPFAGARYAQSWLDLKAGYLAVYYLRRKTSAAVLQSLQHFRAHVRKLNPTYELREVRTDGAAEYASHEANAWYTKRGIIHSAGAPYTPNQTLCEHVWRFLSRIVRADLSHSGLDETFWPYCMNKAVGLWNLMTHAGRDVSPLEAHTSSRQSVAHLRPIGCRAYVLKNERELGASTTFAERAWAGVNLGTVRDGPAFMIYVAELGEVKITTNVDFAVQTFPCRDETRPAPDADVDYYDSPAPFVGGAPGGAPGGGGGGGGFDGDDGDDDDHQLPNLANPEPDDDGGGSGWADGSSGYAPTSQSGESDAGAEPMPLPRRSDRQPQQAADPNNIGDWGSANQNALSVKHSAALESLELVHGTGSTAFVDVSALCDERSGSLCMLSGPGGVVLAVRAESALATKIIPANEALSGSRAEQHREAIDKEVKWGHLEKFKTFILLPMSDKPDDESLIGLKLILAEKFGAANEFLKAKARLVARGDQQVEGRDYDPFETPAPMLNYASLRLLVSIATDTGRSLSSSDATMAYLNAYLNNPVWGRLPKMLREYNGAGEELVAYITKALYGLKTSGHAWSQEINNHLTTPRSEGGMGFTRATGEPCMYRWEDGDEWAIIGLACDNAIHLESSDAVHADVLARLQDKYEWVDEGLISDVPTLLGTKIVQDLVAGTCSISQEGYIKSMASENAESLTSKKVQTPAAKELEEHVREAILSKDKPRDAGLIAFYQRLVGSMLFAAMVTRPDIAWTIGMLSRAMAYPTEALKADAIRCLNYLSQTKHLTWNASKSTFFSARTATPMQRNGDDLTAVFAFDEAHSDSDFAAGPSVSGFCVAAAGAAFAYGSKKGAGTMLCTSSAELVAASVCATHIVWARDLAEFMGFPQAAPTTLYIDNRATVALAHNPMSFSKVKHVARRHHYVRECVEDGTIAAKSIATEHNVSDIFTKALDPKKFKLFRAALMNLPLESLA